MSRRFARRYAKALLAAADGIEEEQKARDELVRFVEAVRQVPDIEKMAANPAIPRHVKERVLQQIATALGLGALVRSFLELLLRNYRLHLVETVLEAVDDAIDRHLGVVTAKVTTAQPLNETQRSRLATVLESFLDQKEKIRLQTATDPEILGGFVARIGSQRYDASLDGQIRRLASSLAEEA